MSKFWVCFPPFFDEQTGIKNLLITKIKGSQKHKPGYTRSIPKKPGLYKKAAKKLITKQLENAHWKAKKITFPYINRPAQEITELMEKDFILLIEQTYSPQRLWSIYNNKDEWKQQMVSHFIATTTIYRGFLLDIWGSRL